VPARVWTSGEVSAPTHDRGSGERASGRAHRILGLRVAEERDGLVRRAPPVANVLVVERRLPAGRACAANAVTTITSIRLEALADSGGSSASAYV
jgi:hypothetical protein